MARPRLSGRSLWRAERAAVTAVVVTTNLIGALAVVLLAVFVVPMGTRAAVAPMRAVDLQVAAGYVVVAVLVGVWIGTVSLRRLQSWLVEDRVATAAEQRSVLRAPLRLFVLQMVLWTVAAVLFGALDATYVGVVAFRVAVVIALTGTSTAACAYLLTERLVRPVAARALASGDLERVAVPGVTARAVLAWALGTGVPVTGLAAIGVLGLTGSPGVQARLAVAAVSLCVVALTVGLLAILVATRATADPVESVRRALDRVQHGDLSVQVPVYDGTQLGRLQAGFNRMAAGLAERERIREAFGTYVDRDVATRILEEGTSLHGEEVEVTVVFIDVRGFTTFAEGRPARQVVDALNELFARIVPIVADHGGHVDKFIGDGLLAVFGAPRRLVDHADRALAAALAIDRALVGQPLAVGIGLNSGTVVAGAIGGAGRLEFSVIGDVVNVAARIEAATRLTGDAVLLGPRTAEILRCDVPLTPRPGMVLKGKAEQVVLYAPAAAGHGEPPEDANLPSSRPVE